MFRASEIRQDSVIGSLKVIEEEKTATEIKTKEQLLAISLENPDDYQCNKCHNTRTIVEMVEHKSYPYKISKSRHCECMNIINALKRIKKSGLEDMIKKFTFENYQVKNSLQKMIKEKAVKFSREAQSEWFFIGGRVGTGKSHICVSIASHLLLDRRMSVRYVLWRDLVRELNTKINTNEHEELMSKLQTEKVLYIDDFLKTARGNTPSDADLNKAFDILDARNRTNNLITIISSEHKLSTIAKFDPALSDRIFEKAREYILIIENMKSMRMRSDMNEK